MIERFRETIRAAASQKRALRIRGGGTKDFYGGPLRGEILDTRDHAGVVSYEPTELVVTARCGTRLDELERMLAERGQRLAFEPPHFGETATLGGCVAAGLSGPRRMAAGALRDFVLGAKIIDGRGDSLSFGGQVMKNVAGYDVARLMAGSLGTLGVIVEVSLKVLPMPASEATLRFEMTQEDAIGTMNRWAGRPLPISATCWHAGQLMVRLSGAAAGVAAAQRDLGGETVEEGARFWCELREQRHRFFEGPAPLWRLALPPATAPVPLAGEPLIEWGGGERWLRSEAPAEVLREAARAAGGHACLFRAPFETAEPFQPLAQALARIHRSLKAAFDPNGVFNRGRMYPEW
ncbi:MAG: glycolate oxidase subunit GlcE [Betaproteobacteria bacterium CG2_30_68_42]|nr:MAG: glycolate oxidase subunit GlcE [Betaproteobacteria bacterium CG2_30_68_42]PIX74899.1 MAG: glycolate oxidase subunit GlcE [Rhodocyclales bacterium CG_4_10_14_3_um_filter_68_10]PJA56994.1 MAG: glycolate oxidase subunit GlcE [Rhodocyclales bacterium CG_4_9_14_3_um_filter_68_10]